VSSRSSLVARRRSGGAARRPRPGNPPPLPGKSRNLLDSIQFALDGIVYAVRHERNVKIHFVAAVAVLVACLVLPLDPLGVLMVLGATSLVLVAELINTAIESVVNMTIQGHHPLARIAKDVAAAAVLVSAFFSLGVAWHVLLPAVAGVSWELQGSGWSRLAGDPVPLFWLGGILLALGLVVALAVSHRGPFPPGRLVLGHAALAFGVSAALLSVTREPLAGLLAIPFAAMVSRRHVHTGIHGWPQVLGGATLGVLLSLCLHLAARKVVP